VSGERLWKRAGIAGEGAGASINRPRGPLRCPYSQQGLHFHETVVALSLKLKKLSPVVPETEEYYNKLLLLTQP
jgi:hypothetical protein